MKKLIKYGVGVAIVLAVGYSLSTTEEEEVENLGYTGDPMYAEFEEYKETERAVLIMKEDYLQERSRSAFLELEKVRSILRPNELDKANAANEDRIISS